MLTISRTIVAQLANKLFNWQNFEKSAIEILFLVNWRRSDYFMASYSKSNHRPHATKLASLLPFFICLFVCLLVCCPAICLQLFYSSIHYRYYIFRKNYPPKRPGTICYFSQWNCADGTINTARKMATYGQTITYVRLHWLDLWRLLLWTQLTSCCIELSPESILKVLFLSR